MTNPVIAVQAWAFNPDLQNMIVHVAGHDDNGDRVNIKGLVVEVKGDEMQVRNIYDPQVTSKFCLYEFGDPDGLKLEAWSAAPTAWEVPAEYLTRWDGEEDENQSPA